MAYPQATVSAPAAKRIRHFDRWVFRDEFETTPADVPGGDIIELIDRSGAFLAYAFYSPCSHIAARVVSANRDEPITREFFFNRVKAAIARRAEITGTNAKRLIYSEADGVPGLIVDQYDQWLVIQSRTAGIEQWKPVFVELLQKALKPKGILERSDKEFREEEELPAATQVLAGAVPERIRIEEHQLLFDVDPYHGHKTGFYLDQRDTRRLVRDSVRNGQRVLDAFAYTGAFGIAAASCGARVTCLEQKPEWIELAKANAGLNRVGDRVEFVEGNAFYWLEAQAKAGVKFDWVLLDPPALAKAKADVTKGRQALHHLLVQGLTMLAPGGTLALSICTYHLLGLAEEILRIAASDCGVPLRMVSVTMQAGDHPWILQMPMTHYLMTWCARRDESPAA